MDKHELHGPWSIGDVRYRRDMADWRNIYAANGEVVCVVRAPGREPSPRDLAIVSAPALLEAVERLLAHMAQMQSQCRQYVEPSGYTSFDRKRIAFEYDQEAKDSLFTNDMIYLLDGPEQREVEGLARAAITLATDPGKVGEA